MPKAKGLFLGETYRLHPDIARFTSEVYYEGRARPAHGKPIDEGLIYSPAV